MTWAAAPAWTPIIAMLCEITSCRTLAIVGALSDRHEVVHLAR